MILGKASSTGPTVETAGLCASRSEGGGAQSCTGSVSGRGWCSLLPSAVSWCCFCFRREKLFCPELWLSGDSLRGLVQLLMASDSNWHERIWHVVPGLQEGGGVPACIKGEGKHNLWISKDKGVLGKNQWEEEVPLWGGRFLISVSHLTIYAVLVLDTAK